jgi:alkylhydroperoxidase family enzyme
LREHGVDEDLYANVENLAFEGYSEQERLAIEYAERFVYDHLRIDDEFWARMHAAFSDQEILDLTICIGSFIALGRTLVVLGIGHDH